jgi:hypothetical protein
LFGKPLRKLAFFGQDFVEQRMLQDDTPMITVARVDE